MQATETVSNTNCCQIVSIAEFGSRKKEQIERWIEKRMLEEYGEKDEVTVKNPLLRLSVMFGALSDASQLELYEYTLSKLNATSYIDKLKKWIVNENEPYVQEDGINAIGVLADITDLPFIEKYTLSSDPVIRSKAYKSLLQIDKENFLEKKYQQISGDPYSIVNYIVDESTFDTTETLDELLSISPDNNKIYDQTYESVGTVINC